VTDVDAAAGDVGMVTNPLLGDEMTSTSQYDGILFNFIMLTTITRSF